MLKGEGRMAKSDDGFDRRTFLRGGVAAVLPVDVRIPGCPPRPPEIVAALLDAMGRLEVRTRAGV